MPEIKKINQALLRDAIALVNDLFVRKKDKAGKPYIEQFLRIMLAVESLEQKITAVLSGVLEDTEYGIFALSENFGEDIVRSIAILSRNSEESHEAYIDRIIKSGNQNAIAVKIAELKIKSDRLLFSNQDDLSQVDFREFIECERGLYLFRSTEVAKKIAANRV